ncbi:lysine exporter LysO family protein [Alginatibacterium sediminis]|uniref:Lysine exporter LysO family protein n=1 Tax=Alginatibacterium sediminis TaxID=2164068 RepID=A0A420E941_9ALTE|nr:lysine exporter LysO family protein [Alginatibacterium sediminis]RKF15814.1 lysine exporter LysO family protein [Alginatibacterium sediminis]
MYSGLLMILGALVLGYMCPPAKTERLHLINQVCKYLLFLILFLMGYGLSNMPELQDNLKSMLSNSFLFLSLLLLFNGTSLVLLKPLLAMPEVKPQNQTKSNLGALLEPVLMIATVLGALLLGLVLRANQMAISLDTATYSEWALILMVLLIGIQLRSSGISLRQILLNRRGLIIAVTILLSSIPAGLLGAKLSDLPALHGLALSSGYGWYSLSGVLISESINPALGATAFIVDLGRELLTLVLIPVFIRTQPAAIIGISGATAMDFSLPMISRSGGPNMVPIAVVSGFILSLACPVVLLSLLSLIHTLN